MMHGSDERHDTEKILTALEQVKTPSLSIDICVTPNHGRWTQLRELSSDHRHSVRIHRNISSIEAMIPQTDLGIVNFGTGCFDLAFHGVPMLAIDSDNAKTAALRQALLDTGSVEKTDSGTIIDA